MIKETKKEKFTRLTEKRVSKALSEMRKVGNLAAPTYEYTEEQVGAIIGALRKAIVDIEGRFSEPCSAENEDFHFVDWLTDEVEPDEDDDGIETIKHTDENP